MIIYPCIEIQNGRCVNLWRGQMDKPTVFDVSPVEAAVAFAGDGAEWLHVTDLDAVTNSGDNAEIIREIIRKAGAPVQVGGGVRTMSKVDEWVDAGAGRVVIGTAAVTNPDFARDAAHAHPDQIVVSIDARDGKVLSSGWTEASLFEPVAFAKHFEKAGLAAIIFTDIDRDDDAPDSSFALTTELAAALTTPVISSGMVRSVDDISTLKYLYNIAGALVGRALFNKALTLPEALEAAKPEAEKVAAFR